ncbi:hypothetical protein ACFYYN_20270 [Streptomyces sp. NPDC001902]
MTKARLGEDSDEPERRLTKNLAPVREVMEAGDLDFDQLLQRDLDDHRVAVKLVPYLLERQITGPAFFPPIVAVLLPFKSKKPTTFAPLGRPEIVADSGTKWKQEQAGNAFQVQRHVLDDGQLDPANFGKLKWNDTESKLVVLDGQHRAMALLAVERTQSRSWQGSPGERFRSFYEFPVGQALKRFGDVDLSGIEVPVTVCWFPEETGEQSNPHGVARKLFVDVNREARPPSKSRIILLSDAELSNVLTRRVLSDLRKDTGEAQLPIYAVEYDNPDTNNTQPARWSVLTNIHLLKRAVELCVFGPQRPLLQADLRFSGGRPPEKAMDEFMRSQLDLSSVFPEPVEDGSFRYAWNDIKNTKFPLSYVDAISDRFSETWGEALITLLSRTEPYAAHARALNQLRETWDRHDPGQSLAHDALFNGVGVFWTLRDSFDTYLESKQSGQPAAKSDVIRAWEILRDREEEFEVYRSKEYRDNGRTGSLKQTKAAFAVFNTHACQLGMALTLGSLWELRKQQPNKPALSDLPKFADDLAAAWNAYFALEPGKAKDRRLAFNKAEVHNPLNQIANMDTPQAVYFRYFWLQILDIDEAWAHIERWFDGRTAFRHMLSGARGLYLELCVDQQIRALRTSLPGEKENAIRLAAERNANAALGRALRDWFYGTDEPFRAWQLEYGQAHAQALKAGAAAATPVPAQAAAPPESAASRAEHPTSSIEDLLSE